MLAMRPGRLVIRTTRSDRKTASAMSWVTNRAVLRLGAPDAQQLVLELLAGDRVEGAERLVQSSTDGSSDERAGEGGPLLHAAGELAGALAARSRPGRACRGAAGARGSCVGARARASSTGSSTLSSTLRQSSSTGRWKTMATSGEAPRSGAPSSSTCPADGSSRPAISRSRVVLPQPLSPTIATNSPAHSSRSTPSSAWPRSAGAEALARRRAGGSWARRRQPWNGRGCAGMQRARSVDRRHGLRRRLSRARGRERATGGEGCGAVGRGLHPSGNGAGGGCRRRRLRLQEGGLDSASPAVGVERLAVEARSGWANSQRPALDSGSRSVQRTRSSTLKRPSWCQAGRDRASGRAGRRGSAPRRPRAVASCSQAGWVDADAGGLEVGAGPAGQLGGTPDVVDGLDPDGAVQAGGLERGVSS